MTNRITLDTNNTIILPLDEPTGGDNRRAIYFSYPPDVTPEDFVRLFDAIGMGHLIVVEPDESESELESVITEG